MNHLIRITPVRLIGPDDEQIGVVETSEAMRRAQEAGLDLVEIVPDARPPVCKIMDYGKYKYELSQKARKTRAASKATEMKQIRLGRSVKIDPHDVQIRIDQARRFLMAGHKVHIVQRFRGREIAHRELGLEHLKECVTKLSDICKVEQTPRWMGKEASIIIAPDKVKVEAVKRRIEKEKAEKAKAEGKTEAQIAAEEEARIKAEEAKIAAAEAEGDDQDSE
ncbi:MAG: translation initiation factor IF-3 [Phycisphaeraceae bacterium]|nr:translation initiation factor IF-3 [Phycisphaeraceae bacterium]